ncbi:unknown [Haloarcula marismortui ATCC 43049]|jgi:hypothetical protein|uniref:Uncharacterized protein n=1 Tax=Haloarcula marismortui (strain ATCC 43049 / DSM 3752 / JCM 8966 / VKM B-1809) TaxID=272569 RepID=Q5V4E0_HALMA|nr:hypothetical protein [Haloarcula marismortui]AAV45612.1 unknown [Haloarcula marismortui ATCC 43049]QCP90397.1 hypothetical protein E6P14_05815 [Haloarcula marismortui ATCC 43049]
MAEWLPDDLEPEDGTLADSAADATGTYADWALSPVQEATGVGPTASETADFIVGAYGTPPEEGEEYNQDAVLTGPARDAYDYAFDYDGEWGGQDDQHDLAGPSVDLGAALDAESDEPVFRRQSDPDAGSGLLGYGMVGAREAGGIVVVVALLLLGAPYVQAAASATGGSA